jgi:peptide/nickel transport system substrate-binding protein
MLDIWEDECPGTILYQPLETYGVKKSVRWRPYTFYFMDLRADNLSFG